MRHDDQGDEVTGSGERPDPSTRHWRHPSELGQQRGLPHPDPTPIGSGSSAGGASTTVWPLVAVGGCLAIATLGVIGLGTNLSRPDSLQVGTAASVAPTQTTFRTAAFAPIDNAISGSLSSESLDPEADEDQAGQGAAIPTTSLARPRNPGQSPSSQADGADTPSTDLLGTPSLAEMAAVPVYGVYAAPLDEGKLGSFIMIGDNPITSASSLGDRRTVWLRVETNWIEAIVIADDPITDVALLDIVGDLEEVTLPSLALAVEPVELGALAMVGYGDPSTIDGRDYPWNATGDDLDPDDRDPNDRDPDDGGSNGWDPNDGGQNGGDPNDEGDPNDGGWAALSTDDWVSASDRRGLIYSLTKPLTTGSGRLIHDPVRLHTVPGPADAGAPLRNQDGDIIGLVAHSTLPQVAAVPIDRVVEAVGWLKQHGVGNPAWLGLSAVAQPGGLVVTAVDQGSPVSDLAPGDVIVAVDRQLVLHPDSLQYAARLVGPGNPIELTVDRRNRRSVVTVEVGTIPLP